MALELFVNQYFVVESQTKEIHDSPTIGASYDVKIGKTEYGPYPAKSDAEKKIALLKVERTQEGWTEARQNKKRLCKRDFDIHYTIKQDSKPF